MRGGSLRHRESTTLLHVSSGRIRLHMRPATPAGGRPELSQLRNKRLDSSNGIAISQFAKDRSSC